MLSIPYDWHADEPQTAYARRIDSTAQHSTEEKDSTNKKKKGPVPIDMAPTASGYTKQRLSVGATNRSL